MNELDKRPANVQAGDSVVAWMTNDVNGSYALAARVIWQGDGQLWLDIRNTDNPDEPTFICFDLNRCMA
jgi:hypothetical protein